MTASQILLNNFLSDLPLMTVATDSVDADAVIGAARWHIHDVLRFMTVFGLISTVFDLLAFTSLQYLFRADQAVFQTGWFFFSLLTELIVVLVLRTRKPAFRSKPGRLLLLTTLAVTIVALGIPYFTPWTAVFGFTVLPLPATGAMISLIVLYLLITEAAKVLLYRRKTASSG